MADPTIKIKRSAVEGKIPTADQVPLGEIALNTYDGKLFTSKNVGIGTTVFVVNPWTVGTGTNTYNTYFTAGNVGINTTTPSYGLELSGSRAWFKPNSDGTEAIALSLGRFSDSNNAFYDILTNDASGDVVIHRINRYTGTWFFRRTSPTGEVNGLSFTSSFTSGTSVSIGNSVGNTQVYLYTNGNSYFNNDGAVLVGSATSTNTANQKLQVTGGAYVSGDVGIGTTNPAYKLHVVGSFGATTKSFIIDHPTQEGKKLQYACLEGPENSVYIRGKSQGSTIELPEYWTNLVDDNSITVNLTPIGESATPRIRKIENNTVEVFSKEEGELDYFYIIFAERKDVAKLEVEF